MLEVVVNAYCQGVVVGLLLHPQQPLEGGEDLVPVKGSFAGLQDQLKKGPPPLLPPVDPVVGHGAVQQVHPAHPLVVPLDKVQAGDWFNPKRQPYSLSGVRTIVHGDNAPSV